MTPHEWERTGRFANCAQGGVDVEWECRRCARVAWAIDPRTPPRTECNGAQERKDR